jgi:hypothetical protein
LHLVGWYNAVGHQQGAHQAIARRHREAMEHSPPALRLPQGQLAREKRRQGHESPYVVGVTATRTGLTEDQRWRVQLLLATIRPRLLQHGDCIGGDAEVDEIAHSLGIRRAAHPCDIADQRAYCGCEVVNRPKNPLLRNRHIVCTSHLLIVLPSSVQERLRSGTWATYRFAKQSKRPIILMAPGQRTKFIPGENELAGLAGLVTATARDENGVADGNSG